jgi:hypothetical protein
MEEMLGVGSMQQLATARYPDNHYGRFLFNTVPFACQSFLGSQAIPPNHGSSGATAQPGGIPVHYWHWTYSVQLHPCAQNRPKTIG